MNFYLLVATPRPADYESDNPTQDYPPSLVFQRQHPTARPQFLLPHVSMETGACETQIEGPGFPWTLLCLEAEKMWGLSFAGYLKTRFAARNWAGLIRRGEYVFYAVSVPWDVFSQKIVLSYGLRLRYATLGELPTYSQNAYILAGAEEALQRAADGSLPT